VLGALKENDEFAPLNGDEIDREQLDSKRVTGLGRYRFWEFFGYAGDFIHSFISDPPETLVTLTKELTENSGAKAGAGKSWIHRNSDGTVIIQSVADIRLERVCRIPVAVRAEPHEDPRITRDRQFTNLNNEFRSYLKLPSILTPTDKKQSFQMAYHIRSYARWLSRYHAFARMLQMESEYNIPSESDSPVPDWNNKEDDRQQENPRADYYDAYACVTIMRDGSIVLYDGYSSSVVLSNGNVQISAARHLDLEAAGDVRVVAGHNIIMKARRNVEISAALGGVIVHGYAWLKMIAEKGTAWLRSNAITKKTVNPLTAKKDGGPVPEVAGWVAPDPGSGEPGQDGFAVLIEATEGNTTIRSERGINIAVDGSPSQEDANFDVTVSTKGKLDLHGQVAVDMHSPGPVSVSSQAMVAIYSTTFLSNASRWIMGPSLQRPFVFMEGGKFYCRTLRTNRVDADGIFGPEIGPYVPYWKTIPSKTAPAHWNHIQILREKVGEVKDIATMTEVAIMARATLLASYRPDLPWQTSQDGPEWAFPGKDEYAWDTREEIKGAIPETITQQHLRLDDSTKNPSGAPTPVDRWGGAGYLDWDLKNTLVGKRTKSQGGFGTSEVVFTASDQGDDLHKPTENAAKDTTPVVRAWNPKPTFIMKILKREDDP
jgi:hypothetical protein